ncbi:MULTISPECIES: flagellar protein FlaG [Methylomicrobium]|uniref:Flagellar protein FlaG n=1 Tax=Methylomicrobium album BG8 TaxID=686340 RepID=H8GMU6_METAL|nr:MULTISPECIES: flagellar protein FlaG [Methylomicrobium]EIC29498.1 flagellar protein FlaG [Methylomicrobium album BG8]
MDIGTSMTQQRPPAPAATPEPAVQAKVPIDPAPQAEAATVEARLVPDAVSGAGKDQAKDPEKLGNAVSKLNDFVQNIQRDLQFSLDEGSGEMIVKVIDTKSQQVIRQIPSEEALRLARSLAEQNDKGKLTIFSSTA